MTSPTAQRRGPGSRADEHHPTRHELLDAAVVVAERDGIAGLTAASITRQAQLGKGTFYIHFADRTTLLVAVHRRFHDELFDGITRTTQSMPPGPNRAAARLGAFLDGCRSQPGVRALLLDARSDPAIADEVRRRNRQATDLLAADLLAPNPGSVARLIVAATIEVAGAELLAGRRLSRLRAALISLLR